MLRSSQLQRIVVLTGIEIWEECITSIFRIENHPSKEPDCSRRLGSWLSLLGAILPAQCDNFFTLPATLKIEASFLL
jgi:hypothetical protein